MIESDRNQHESDALVFEGGDPGAVRHGNFINYYTFHSASSRVVNFPEHIWSLPMHYPETLACLDIGCNTGELTLEIHQSLSRWLRRDEGGSTPAIKTLGVDFDPVLIQRAQEKNLRSDCVQYVAADITAEATKGLFEDFLQQIGVPCFSAVFLMSVTMWVHLAHGDEALHALLLRCGQLTDRWLVIEPQPWSCYRSAQRRLIKSGVSGFPFYSKLTIKGPKLLSYMHKVLTEECAFIRVHETQPSSWKRTISFYQKNYIFT